MKIRPEASADYPQIYRLVKTAFETAPMSDGDEQNFVERLRAGENYIPQLALVAEESTTGLIGQTMLTRASVGSHEVLLLAPVSVVLEWRGQGVGAALIREGLQRATAAGYTAVCVVGNPAYYTRFGFRPAAEFGIGCEGISPEYVMALELVSGALGGVHSARLTWL